MRSRKAQTKLVVVIILCIVLFLLAIWILWVKVRNAMLP